MPLTPKPVFPAFPIVTGATEGKVVGVGADGQLVEQDAASGSATPVQDEGVEVVATPTALNFTGTGVTVTDVGGVATVDVPGGSGIAVEADGVAVASGVTTINFAGFDSVTDDGGGQVTVTAPAAGTTLPSWLDSHPDDPPASADSDDDEFSAGSLDAQWTWRNQGTASVSFSNDALLLTPTQQAGDQIRGVEIAVPAGAWKFRAHLAHTAKKFNYSATGLYLVDSVSGRLVLLQVGADNSTYYIGATRMNSVSSWNSAPATDTSLGASTMQGTLARYLEIERDGSNNLIFRYSATGIEGTFLQLYTESHTAWLTNGPSHIGLFANCNNTTAANLFKGVFLWFRQIS